MSVKIVDKEQIGLEMLSITKTLIEHKLENINNKKTHMAIGYLFGLMTALGKDEEITNADNWLNYTNSVIKEIFENQNEHL